MITLAPDVWADIVPNVMLTGTVYLSRLVLYAADADVRSYQNNQLLKLIGSSDQFTTYEQVLFDKDTRLLKELLLHIAETDTEDVNAIYNLADTPVVDGLLRLKEHSVWGAEGATARYVAPQADMMVCLFSHCESAQEVELRLRVAPDVFLLLGKQQWLGWAIARPAAYICDVEVLPVDPSPSAELCAALAAYYDLVKEPFDEWGKSPHILRRLHSLYIMLAGISDPFDRQQVLRDWIVDVTETFYGDISLDTLTVL